MRNTAEASFIGLCEAAQHAIRAAKSVKAWGMRNACLYAQKRGVLPLFWLAYRLETGAI